MARTWRKAHTRIAPDGAIGEMRSRLPWLVARIATAIQLEVGAYSGPVLGRRRKLIESAIDAGLRELLGRVSGKARSSAAVDELFYDLGRAEAVDRQTLEAMRCAHDVATREVWEELHRLAVSQGLPTTVLGRLGDALFEQIGHLRDEVEAGYRAALDELKADLLLSREHLAQRLLEGGDESELETSAASARWLLPEHIVVLCARAQEDSTPVDAGQFELDVLVAFDSPYVLVMCDARLREELVTQARQLLDAAPLAISIPIDPARTDAAARLARRAHQLAEQRVIRSSDIVDCADHEELLWLHAEPILRERLANRLLAPLIEITPHRRRMLAQTLLLWLEHRASAPAIADKLDVHPQTVRHRLRQLDAMFEGRLNNPELAFATLLALKATLPSWQAAAPSKKDD